MSIAEDKLSWCLKKALKEGEKHRGLKPISANEHKANVLLVAAGLKPAGELRFAPYLSKYESIAAQLGSIGLETCMTHRSVDRFLNCEPHEADCMRAKLGDVVPYQLVFWHKERGIEKEAVDSCISDTYEFGRLLGYPDCCVDAFCEESIRQYSAQLKEKFRAQGMPGIEHLIGIEHLPCSVDCCETVKLGYASFLNQNAPELYAAARSVLVAKLGMV